MTSPILYPLSRNTTQDESQETVVFSQPLVLDSRQNSFFLNSGKMSSPLVRKTSTPAPAVTEDVLFYENLAENHFNRVDNYSIFYQPPYIHIEHESGAAAGCPRPIGQSYDVGWKLHISIKQIEQLAMVWSIVHPILRDNAVKHFKVFYSQHLSTMENQGKQITIYQFKNPEISKVHWYKIMSDIEEQLLRHSIAGDIKPIADKRIDGSHFFSYRNDRSPLNIHKYIADNFAVKYSNETSIPAYNLTAELDPFEGIKLDNQVDGAPQLGM